MAGRGAERWIGTWPLPDTAGLPEHAGTWGSWLRPWPISAALLSARLRQWVEAETAPGRLMPWLPIAFGTGIVIYFAAEREPVWWVAATLATFAAAAAFALRERAVAFPLALGCAAVVAGFATASVKTHLIDHAVLSATAYSVGIAGFVDQREERERSDRIVLRVATIDGARLAEHPERIRLSVRKGRAPPVGAYVALKARINPPASPFRPGGYDLARDLFFQGIGATGLALGAIKVDAPPSAPGVRLQFATGIESIRDAINARIRARLHGDTGAIASALLTGKRDALTGAVFDAMFISGVGHVLSISGYHMALVAGVVFFFVRALLALVPNSDIAIPDQEVGGRSGARCRDVLSRAVGRGGRDPALIHHDRRRAGRSHGRPPDRHIANHCGRGARGHAAGAEAVVHPSFQMSFAATLALIAAYERGMPWAAAGAETSFGARLALWGVREVALLIIASLVAGLATTPYSGYHFHRLAPYGVLANLFAMPVISAVSMPAGLLALAAMPFGLDGPLWTLMGVGIDWMITVALWVAHLPGAVGRIHAFGIAPLLLATAGLVVLCLLRTPLRFVGAGLAFMAALTAAAAERPDVIVSAAADVVAVRGADGRLGAVKFGNDTLSIPEWLAADGDERTAIPRNSGFACDPDGCVGRLADGALVAVSRTAAALTDDCARAALIITLRNPPPGCAAQVLDRALLRSGGATALFRRNGSFDVRPARPPGFERPWAGHLKAPRRPAASAAQARDVSPPVPDADAEE